MFFFVCFFWGGNKGGFLAIRCRWSRFLKWFHYVSLLLPWTSIASLDIERCTDCCVYIPIYIYMYLWYFKWEMIKILGLCHCQLGEFWLWQEKISKFRGAQRWHDICRKLEADEIFQFTLGDDHPPQGFPHLPWRFWGKALWSTSTSHAGWWLAFPMIHGNGIFTYIDPIKNQPFM